MRLQVMKTHRSEGFFRGAYAFGSTNSNLVAFGSAFAKLLAMCRNKSPSYPYASVRVLILTARHIKAACYKMLPLFLLAILCPHVWYAATMEIEDQRLLEATYLLGGGSPVGAIEILPVPSDMLQSTEFSSLLRAYTEDVTSERRERECHQWVDFEHYKAQYAASTEHRWEDNMQRFIYVAHYGDGCHYLNKQFGAVMKNASVRSRGAGTQVIECTASPWLAEVEIVEVDARASPQGSPYFMAYLNYNPPIPPSFASQVPKAVPLAPTRRAQWAADFRPPAKGDKATLLCLQEGPLVFVRKTEDDGPYLEFLPGPWSTEVRVEMFPDPLRFMGVGVRLRLLENISVTLPPSSVLPVTTAKLTDEQWLLLELAAMRSEEQKLQEAEEEAEQAEWPLTGGDRTSRRMYSFAIGPCRLRRGKGFDDPVVLDCLPPIQAENGRSKLMNAIDVFRRGVWGLTLAIMPVLSVNAPFQSLIKKQGGKDAVTHGLSFFSMKRDWSVSVPENVAKKEKDSERKTVQLPIAWSAEQNKELDLIASEVLQAYARGGKDRRRHTSEKHLKFIETDDKLEIHVSVSYLNRWRRNLLGLSADRSVELVFTFTDVGGAFHPFQKVPSSKQIVNLNLQQNSTDETHGAAGSPNDTTEMSTLTGVASPDASDDPVSTTTPETPKDVQEEERITLLQLLWQNVAEPQHQQLRRIAIANVLWDFGLSIAFILFAYLITKLAGWMNARATAAALRVRRIQIFDSFETNDAAIIPELKDEVQSPVGFGELYTEEETMLSGTSTAPVQKVVPEAEEAAGIQ